MHYSLFLISLLATIADARGHRLCACQVATDGAIDNARTQQVAMESNGGFIYSNYIWTGADGARFNGKYFHALEGSGEWKGNKATGNGWLDGDFVYGLCRNAGAADSTCFNTGDWKRCNSGNDGCYNTYGSTDGNGKLV